MVNPFLNDKILDRSKFKTNADNKITVIHNLNFVLGMVENILGKGGNAGYQHFVLLAKCFQKVSFLRVVKSQDYLVKA